MKSTKIHVFKDALEVEIAARCCRKWVEPDVLDDAAVQLAGRVLEAGQQQLGNQPYMSILFSSYHIDVQVGQLWVGYAPIPGHRVQVWRSHESFKPDLDVSRHIVKGNVKVKVIRPDAL